MVSAPNAWTESGPPEAPSRHDYYVPVFVAPMLALRRSNLDPVRNLTLSSYGVITNLGLVTVDTSGSKGATVGVTVKTATASQT